MTDRWWTSPVPAEEESKGHHHKDQSPEAADANLGHLLEPHVDVFSNPLSLAAEDVVDDDDHLDLDWTW